MFENNEKKCKKFSKGMCIKGSLYVILLFQRELPCTLPAYTYLVNENFGLFKGKVKNVAVRAEIDLLYWQSRFKMDLPVYKIFFFFFFP